MPAQSKQLCQLRGWEITFWNHEGSYLNRSDYRCNEAFPFRCDIFRLLWQNKLWNCDVHNHNPMPTVGLVLKEQVLQNFAQPFCGFTRTVCFRQLQGMPGIRLKGWTSLWFKPCPKRRIYIPLQSSCSLQLVMWLFSSLWA